MRLKIKQSVALVFGLALGLLLISAPALAVDDPSGGSNPIPKDVVSYDDVGYAISSGRNDEWVSASHAELPVGSFAEITNINDGKTILVRITDRGPLPRGVMLGLSAAALRQLEVNGGGAFPVRVRRTNPPEYEQAQLAAGGIAKERLATPPGLLAALRLKLGGMPAPRNVEVAAAQMPKTPAPRWQPKPRPVPQALPAPEQERPVPSRRAREETVETTNDGFILEGDDQPRTVPSPRATRRPVYVAPIERPGTQTVIEETVVENDTLYVQIGAFSSIYSARALAARTGAQVIQAGNIYRVRKGPYADEASARWALGSVVSKGYPNARITH